MHDTPAPPPTATTTTTGVALFGLFLTVTTPLSMASPAVPSAHISNSHLWKDGPVEVEARQTVEAAEAELLGLRSALAFAEWNFRANLGDVEGEQRRADAQVSYITTSGGKKKKLLNYHVIILRKASIQHSSLSSWASCQRLLDEVGRERDSWIRTERSGAEEENEETGAAQGGGLAR